MQLCQSSLWVVRRGRETTACVAGMTLGWSTQGMCSLEVNSDGDVDLSSFNCPQSFMSLTHGLINLLKSWSWKMHIFSYILSSQCKSSTRHMILDQGNDNLFLHWKKINLALLAVLEHIMFKVVVSFETFKHELAEIWSSCPKTWWDEMPLYKPIPAWISVTMVRSSIYIHH